jgi:hypothetical protein
MWRPISLSSRSSAANPSAASAPKAALPPDERSKYNLYDGKAAFGAEAAEGLAALERELNEIGRHISWSRGDYQE